MAGLATGLSRFAQFMSQLKGVIYVGFFTFVVSFIVWHAIKLVLGVRVSPEEEEEGLDIGEHGMHAYDIPATGSSVSGVLGSTAAAVAGATEFARGRSTP